MNASDLIIIGAGPGGYEMAVEAATKGLTVTIFEENKPGGTCLNEGCIPTKALCRNAEVAETVKRAGEFGVNMGESAWQIDMAAVQSRKQEVVSQLVAGVEGLLSKPGITLVRAHAEFKDAKTVVADGEEYTAKNIVIATGSETRLLPVPGMDLAGVLTSKEMLEIDYVPKHLCVIGAGVIGLEFASIFHRLGSEVTMVEFAKEILPPFDSDIAKRLKQTLTKSGIAINTSAGVTGVAQSEGGLTVSYEQKGKQMSVEADTVLVAVGRGARTAGLNLEAAGVEYTRRGITVDDNMQTNVKGIYAIGDVNARCMLAHAATFQGLHALHQILGETDKIRLDIIPAAVFCQPEAAMVGMTEEQCKEAGIEVKCHKSFFRANGKALSMGEADGFCKLIAEKESGKIVGCHLFGAHSADLVQEVAALMNGNATVDDLAQIVHAHPTLSEVILAAARG
ncbi:MAG: dihydrolipoyl dehydrogenase [Bacteroidaceae bacterium]|nr:dihydrolipoyl dehydrogenase [Bacteroidaceae bacterium]